MSSFKLLSTGNPKTLKGQKQGYITFILHLAPADLSGYEVCPKRTAGCTSGCLNKAGHGGMFKRGETTNMVQKARIRKTVQFFTNRAQFMSDLFDDITRAIKYAKKKGFIPVFRLNGTSDLPWNAYSVGKYKNIFEAFPEIQFYDYTAVLNRFNHNIPNYHLTFSVKENNESDVKKAISIGANIAVVFDLKKKQEMPAEYLGIPVINADENDLRFLDPKGIVCGLYIKGNLIMKNHARIIGFAKTITL